MIFNDFSLFWLALASNFLSKSILMFFTKVCEIDFNIISPNLYNNHREKLIIPWNLIGGRLVVIGTRSIRWGSGDGLHGVSWQRRSISGRRKIAPRIPSGLTSEVNWIGGPHGSSVLYVGMVAVAIAVAVAHTVGDHIAATVTSHAGSSRSRWAVNGRVHISFILFFFELQFCKKKMSKKIA